MLRFFRPASAATVCSAVLLSLWGFEAVASAPPPLPEGTLTTAALAKLAFLQGAWTGKRVAVSLGPSAPIATVSARITMSVSADYLLLANAVMTPIKGGRVRDAFDAKRPWPPTLSALGYDVDRGYLLVPMGFYEGSGRGSISQLSVSYASPNKVAWETVDLFDGAHIRTSITVEGDRWVEDDDEILPSGEIKPRYRIEMRRVGRAKWSQPAVVR